MRRPRSSRPLPRSACRRGRSARSCRHAAPNACISPERPMRDMVVLASGRGSNFAALLDAQRQVAAPIRVRALLSDKPQAHALKRAHEAGIDAVALAQADYPDRTSFDRALFARAADYKPDLVVLAGYMRVIDAALVEAWLGRIINIHPSLLPKYPGLRTHARALEAGDSVH